MGRPTDLTPELQERICALITATGCSVEGAAASCDIDARTIYRWRARGMVEGEGLYWQFGQAVQRAREKSEPNLAALIAKAAKDDWKAALTILERRFPERWGNQVTIIRRFEQMTDEELDAFIAARITEDEPLALPPAGIGEAGPEDEAGTRGEAGEPLAPEDVLRG